MVTASAKASITGYLYQFQFALYRLLLGTSDARIGIETDDDIVEAKRTDDGEAYITFVQSKVSLQDGSQPLHDRSRNLWHTVHIWLTLVPQHPGENLSFYFLTNKNVPVDALVRQLAAAKEPAAVDACVAALRSSGPTLAGKALEAADAVLAFDDDALAFVVRRIGLLDDDKPDGGASLRDATIALFQLHAGQKELADSLYRTLLGELIDRCTDAWVNKRHAIFDKEPFTRRLQAELALYTRRRCVEQPFLSLSLQEYMQRDHTDLQFLRQIESLALSQRVWNRALDDYWGFYAERLRLRELGEVLPIDFAARNEELFRRWEDISDNISPEQERRFHSIYSQTLQSDYHGPLAGQRSVYAYFTNGNYHALANGEETQLPLYWHRTDEEGEQ